MSKLFSKESNGSEQINVGFNVLVNGTKVIGDVKSESDFRLDGEIEGSIDCKGKLVLGQKGFVKGNILCENAEISGEVSGNVIIRDTLSLRATAIIGGDINTKILVVETGAVFNGKCSMTSKTVTKKNEPVQSIPS
jgi:cytoskeletal protein CcmA (bactofilin family)